MMNSTKLRKLKKLVQKERVYNINVLIKNQNHRRIACETLISNENLENITDICPTTWDGVLCWTNVKSGTNFTQPCPEYITGFHPNGTASKYCTDEGEWYFDNERNSSWTDFSQCFMNNSMIQIEGTDCDFQHSNRAIMMYWIPKIKLMSQIGYGVSFFVLLIALFVLLSIKKLRCPRNTLHSHLFLSFILRAFMAILKDILFYEGVGLSISILEGDEGLIFRYNEPNWECKLITSLWQYCIVANYIWILMEGLYLHNLLFITPFSVSSSVTLYILLGWGCPIVVVTSWAIARVIFENTLCWTTNSNQNLFLIIKVPIVTSIILNFIFYLNIVRLLFVKLRNSASVSTSSSMYKKWAKSTLILIPLFGIHYMLFLWMSSYIDIDPVIEIIWLFCDQLFASFQGFFVAILYCLLNEEVRSELCKKWSQSKTISEIKNHIPLNQISTKFFRSSNSNVREPAVNFQITPEDSHTYDVNYSSYATGASIKKDFHNHFHQTRNILAESSPVSQAACVSNTSLADQY